MQQSARCVLLDKFNETDLGLRRRELESFLEFHILSWIVTQKTRSQNETPAPRVKGLEKFHLEK